MERHWTKSMVKIREAWKQDDCPISLIALEIRYVDGLGMKESMECSKVLSRIAFGSRYNKEFTRIYGKKANN